jgi:Matrixin
VTEAVVTCVVVVVLLLVYALEHGRPVQGDPGALSRGVVLRGPDLDRLGTYRFLYRRGAAPVAYDPCQPVEYVVETADVPPGGEEVVREAFVRVGQLSGLDFRQVTSGRPEFDLEGSPGFIEVEWADLATDPEVSDEHRDALGLTQTFRGTVGISEYLMRSRVRIDLRFADQVGQGDLGRAQLRAVLLHELGHAVGLAHVDDDNEIMAEDGSGLSDFGPGDRTGLRLLGSGVCR